MTITFRTAQLVGAAITLAVTLGLGAVAQTHGSSPAHETAQPQSTTTKNMQGNDTEAWINDPHMHAFYDLSVATFAKGADKVELEAYKAKSFAIFREFAISKGVEPAAMQDHLKDIPRQLVQIVKDDPKTLDSYKTFTLALFGPE